MVQPELHVTRDEGVPRDEWLAVAAADGELRPFRIGEEKTLHHWTAHKLRGEHPSFWWLDGQIDTDPYDRVTLRKALALAARLGATVVDDDGRVYSDASEYGAAPPGPDDPPPASLLGDLCWTFPADAPADRDGFAAAVWASQYDHGNDRGWDPEELVIRRPQIRISCLLPDDTEPVVLLSAAGGFTAGELLFQLHHALAPSLVGADHRFIEGLELAPARERNGLPLYHVRLGS